MSSALIQILVFMSLTFVLGSLLGWLLGTFSAFKQRETMSTEIEYWQERLNQLRVERDLASDKISNLEHERDNLKKRIKQAGS